MRQEISNAYEASRDGTKTIMMLEEQLKQWEGNVKSLKLAEEERIWSELETNEKQPTEKTDLANSLLESKLKHEHFIKQQSLLNSHGQLKSGCHPRSPIINHNTSYV